MTTGTSTPLLNRRILLIDDNPSIHEDFRKILCAAVETNEVLERFQQAVLGHLPAADRPEPFTLHSAFQGKDGVALAQEARGRNEPYALAFVDIRMPPGWDGVETVGRLWQVDHQIQVVICTAYSDYSWEELSKALGNSENLLILKKPFDNVEVLQLAHALTRKWLLTEKERASVEILQQTVQARTRELSESQRQLATLIRNLPGMAYRCRPDSRRTLDFVSEGSGDLTGYPPSDLLQNARIAFIDLVHPEDREAMFAGVQDALSAHRRFELKYRIRTADGAVKWVWEQGIGVFSAPDELQALEGFVLDVTSQTLGEETLTKYRLLSDHANDLLLFIDSEDGRILEANRAACNHYARSREELLAKTVFDLCTEDSARVADQLRRADDSGCVFETVHRRPDGALFSVEVSARSAVVGGRPLLFGVVRDITERKRSETALRQMNAELEQRVRERTTEALDLYHHAPCGYYALDPNGRVVQMNDTELNWLGRGRDEVEGRLCLDRLMTPLSAERFNRFLPEFVRTGTRSGDEWEMQAQDGSVINVFVHAEAVRDSAGNLLKVRSTALNITQRKQDEQQVRKLSQALEYSPSMILISDRGGRVEYVNHAWERVTGYCLQEVLGQDSIRLISGGQSPEFQAQLRQAITAGNVWRGEFRNRRKNGELYWESAALAPVRDECGAITHFVAVNEDVTRQKEGETELRRAKEAAEAANRAKSAFLANMSHEIRTPMNAILGFSQLLLRDGGTHEHQRQQLSTIIRSGEHLMQVINDILEVARIESGCVALNPAPFDLHLLLGDLERMFSLRSQDKNLRIQTVGLEDVPRRILADETKLRQVLINLLGNAVKFTPSGGSVVLRAGADTEPDGRLRLRVEVEDTGPGIAVEDLPYLFEAFFQTQAGKAVPGGTGLGLCISREFVRLMGGDLVVHSVPGEGSVFRFDIRAGRVDQAPGLAPVAPAPQALRLIPQAGPCRVLIADDCPTNRKLLEIMLAPVGFEVLLATDGAEAVERSREWLPHVVILDLLMPVLDGQEAARRMRACGAPVRIILLSASDVPENYQPDSTEKIDAFLCKPVERAKLLETIRQLVGVEYVYEQPQAASLPAPANSGLDVPSPDELRQLPSELLQALQHATRRADYDIMLTLTDQAATQQPSLGRRLRRLVESYRYDALQEALSRTLAHATLP